MSFFLLLWREGKIKRKKLAEKGKRGKKLSPCISDKAPGKHLRRQPSHAFRVHGPPGRGHGLRRAERVEQRGGSGTRGRALALALDRRPRPLRVVDHRHRVPPGDELQRRPGPDERPAPRLFAAGHRLEEEARRVAVVRGDEAAVREHWRQRVAQEPLVKRDEVGLAPLSRDGGGCVHQVLERGEARVVGRREPGEGPPGSCCCCGGGGGVEGVFMMKRDEVAVEVENEKARATTTATTAIATRPLLSLLLSLSLSL